MTSPRNTLLKRIDRLTARARAYLMWERYAPVLFLAVCAALIFMAGSFAGVWERIGDPWRYIALIAALALLARALWKARALPLPSKSAAARRVESDSGLSHRPFDTVRDAAADTGEADTGLWDVYSQSAAMARVTGIKSAPRLSVTENGRSRRVSVTRLGPTSFEARTVLSQDAKLRWRIGSSPKTWRVDVTPDTAPEVQWTQDPEAGKRDTLDFAYDLSDDFGAVSLALSMQRVNDIAQMGKDAAPVELIDIALSSESVRRAQNKPESLKAK